MNQRNAMFLLMMTLMFVIFGTLLDRMTGRANSPFAISFLGASLVMNVVFFFFSDKIILFQSGAKPLPRSRAPQLHAMTARLAKRAGIPKPALYYLPVDNINAFATGRDPDNAAVAVTLGLIRSLDLRQTEGVVAHEIAHIKNRDTLAASILAAMAGTFGYMARALLPFSARGAVLGPLSRGFRMTMFGAVVLLAAPFVALLLKFAASRSREFEADAEAVRLTRDPGALCSALNAMMSLEQDGAADLSPGLRMLTTFSPKAARGINRLMQTHPPMQVRIRRLEAMGGP